MNFQSLELNRLLFYHAPRTGPEFDDDGGNSFDVWDTYSYTEDVYSKMLALTEATEAIYRTLNIRWGSAEAGSVANINLCMIGADKDATATKNFDRFRWTYQTGEYFNHEAFMPKQQTAGWQAVVQRLGASQYFSESKWRDVTLPAFAPGVETHPHETSGTSNYFYRELEGRKFYANVYHNTQPDTTLLSALLFTSDLKNTQEGLDLTDNVLRALTEAIGPPGDITIEFEFITSDLPTYSPLLQQIGVAFPLVNVLMPYKRRFRPLAPQQVQAGEVHAYPLLILNRYSTGLAPVSPMLVVNVVHVEDGRWIELQSSQRPNLIAQAARIMGQPAEYWQGAPETRWNWYSRATCLPGLAPIVGAGYPLDVGDPNLPVCGASVAPTKQAMIADGIRPKRKAKSAKNRR